MAVRRILSYFSFSFPLRAATDGSRLSSGPAMAFAAGLILAALPLDAAAQTNFGQVNIGSSTTAAATVTFANAATLGSIAVVTQGAANLDFSNAGGGTCTVGTSYAANATCTVRVTFTPKFAGPRHGAVVLADLNDIVLGTGYLLGTGQGPQMVYGVTTPPPQLPATLLGSPTAVGVDDSGNVFIGDSGSATPGTARVLKETLSAGQYIQSTVASGLYNPASIATDGAGNIYILDLGDGQRNSGTNALYKETLFNGNYTQAAIDSLAPTGAFTVDVVGNIYYYGGANTTGAGIYIATLQPDGSYLPDIGPLPSPDPSTIVQNWQCGVADAYGSGNPYITFALDGNNILYFNAFVECTSPYYQPTTYYFVFDYAAGISQPPTAVPTIGAQITYEPPEYLPRLPIMFADARGSLYFINWNVNNTYLTEFIPTSSGVYTSGSLPIPLENISPRGVAVDAGGDILVTGGVNVYTPSGVYKLDYADAPALNFQPTSAGVASVDSPQIVTIANIGNSTLTFSAVSYPTDFPENSTYNDTCTNGTSLATGIFCVLPINFTPVAPLGGNPTLSLSEKLTLTDNAPNSPQSIIVAGTETLPAVAMPVTSPPAGTYTSVQSVSITDGIQGATIYYTTDGTTPTAQSTKYTGPITVSATETIQAIAAAAGYSNSAVLSATYTINLPLDFSLGVVPQSMTVASVGSGTATVSVTPQNGFGSTVSFACSGLPAGALCSFSPPTVTPSGATATTTLKISTSGLVGAVRDNSPRFFPGATLAVALCCLGWRKRRRAPMAAALGVFGLSLLSGCGSGSYSKPPVTSTVTVIATAGSLQHNATFSLTVQ